VFVRVYCTINGNVLLAMLLESDLCLLAVLSKAMKLPTMFTQHAPWGEVVDAEVVQAPGR
jgi:hypothetical protein